MAEDLTTMIRGTAPPMGTHRPVDYSVAAVAFLAMAAGAVILAEEYGPRHGARLLLGAMLGFILYHAAFSFAMAWNQLIVEKRASLLRAQLLMIGVASAGVIPLLSLGNLFGQELRGAVAPVGIPLIIGAAMFGVGMQLAGGGGVRALFAAGGGSMRMLLVLVFFIIGAFVGTVHQPWWSRLPAFNPVELASTLGVGGAVGSTIAGLALLIWLSYAVERRHHSTAAAGLQLPSLDLRHVLRGPWPSSYAAMALAALLVVTVVLTGHTWTVIPGTRLWGAKVAEAIGMPVGSLTFWNGVGPANAIGDSVLADRATVVNFGVLLGAAFAASLAGRFAVKTPLSARSALAAMTGGLLMGYGGLIGFGCSIGAMVGGITSGSVHGWLWFAAAFLGTYLAVRAKSLFGSGPYHPSVAYRSDFGDIR